ncbi:MAG: CHC2 zinc finger domain-containing protein [Candidatus Gastranaerophilales bacterium]|nr:CHC2 zinc finger domain-containing protein [Candidatus Gastranaerophilales bacterium]
MEAIYEKLLKENYAEILFEDLINGKTKRTGDGVLVCCPFHDDNDPSFHISFNEPVYYCFGCGKTGNWIQYLEETREMTSYEAIKFLAGEAGIELNSNWTKELQEKELVQQMLNEANEFYKVNFKDLGEEIIKKYAKHRGFTEETIEKFQIGYAPVRNNALYNHLIKIGYAPEDVLKTGLFIKQKNDNITDHFQGRITYPYLKFGKPVYFIAGITKETPKWDKSKYKKLLVHSEDMNYVSPYVQNNTFYCEDMIYKSDTIFITEGVTDCITLNQYGYPSISPVTVKFRKEDYGKLAKLLKDKTVYICNDNEENKSGQHIGFEGAKETAKELLKKGILAKIILLPHPSIIQNYQEDRENVQN